MGECEDIAADHGHHVNTSAEKHEGSQQAEAHRVWWLRQGKIGFVEVEAGTDSGTRGS